MVDGEVGRRGRVELLRRRLLSREGPLRGVSIEGLLPLAWVVVGHSECRTRRARGWLLFICLNVESTMGLQRQGYAPAMRPKLPTRALGPLPANPSRQPSRRQDPWGLTNDCVERENPWDVVVIRRDYSGIRHIEIRRFRFRFRCRSFTTGSTLSPSAS